MRDLVRENRGLPIVRAHAERAVVGVPSSRPTDVIRAMYAYLGALVEYRPDPNGFEYLQAPWSVFSCQIDRGQVPQLDCDDLTMLGLAPLESLGLRTAFRVVSHRPDRLYNHVYGLVELGDRSWMKFDLVDLWQPPGGTPPAETRAFELEVN